jgi:8-oxo-dGTP diphosphatase
MSIQDAIVKQYGNRLRVRVCGFLVEDDKLLVLNHANLGSSDFWIPPGGGMEFGESATLCLAREFLEETGLEITVKRFLCLHEFLIEPLHGIELFFEVEKVGGELRLGYDPEMHQSDQILQQLNFLSKEELLLLPEAELHPILALWRTSGNTDTLMGYNFKGTNI